MRTDEIMALADAFAWDSAAPIEFHSKLDEASRAALRAAVEQVVRERDETRNFWQKKASSELERAERAERQRDEAMAMLKWVREHAVFGGTETARRIDALLGEKK